MSEYQTPVEALPGWPTEPEFESSRPPILPPGYTYGVGAGGRLVAVPVHEQPAAPSAFAPASQQPDVWPKRLLAATPLVGASGAAGYFLLHALAAAAGSLIAIAVLVAMAWAAKGARHGGGPVNVSTSVNVNVSNGDRR